MFTLFEIARRNFHFLDSMFKFQVDILRQSEIYNEKCYGAVKKLIEPVGYSIYVI